MCFATWELPPSQSILAPEQGAFCPPLDAPPGAGGLGSHHSGLSDFKAVLVARISVGNQCTVRCWCPWTEVEGMEQGREGQLIVTEITVSQETTALGDGAALPPLPEGLCSP